jgi:hypothetical protein
VDIDSGPRVEGPIACKVDPGAPARSELLLHRYCQPLANAPMLFSVVDDKQVDESVGAVLGILTDRADAAAEHLGVSSRDQSDVAGAVKKCPVSTPRDDRG